MAKIMIEVKDSAEFKRLLQALSRDIVDAHVHYRFCRDIDRDVHKHHLVYAQSKAFWSLTVQAHLNTCVCILCRVYDQERKSLHLRSWLLTIKENLDLFGEDQFRKRLGENPYVNSLAQDPRIPDEAQLNEDIRLCSNEDPTVRVLTIHRGSRIAHKSATNIIAERNIGNDYPLTFGDVDILLNRAIEILNRYSGLFQAEYYSTSLVGQDDYKYILKCVEEKVLEQRKAWDRAKEQA